jgi:5-methylcytosine-specific restriction protein B
MARFTESNRRPVDQLVDRWRLDCLIHDGSLLHEDATVWTLENLGVLTDTFVNKELIDDRSFEDKLREQMEPLEPGPVRLMAEVIAMYAAFASLNTVGATRKRELVVLPLNTIDESLPEESFVWESMDGGIGGPGQGFNSFRPNLLSYIIRFATALKGEHEDRRRQLVAADADPWAFRVWLDHGQPNPAGGGSTMRNILLHLLFPDSYERIAVDSDKAQIVGALHKLVPGLDPAEADVDEALFAIRGRLLDLMPDGQASINGSIDFYYTPLRESWDPEQAGEGRTTDRGLSHVAALEYKKQVVLYGPPGTGKTYEAKELSEQLIRREAMRRWGPVHCLQNDERVREIVASQVKRRQLHPAYSYEDFIGGIRLEGGDTVPTKGHLLQLIDTINESRENCPDPEPLPWVLILDEINRADLSRLLGEVFSALDDRDATIELSAAGSEEWPPLRLPSDLHIVGTMNLIDQSVEQMDFALRRRFFWLLAGYREDIIVPVVGQKWEALDLDKFPWLKRHGWEYVQPDIECLAERATRLNDAVTASSLLGAQYQLGHTYFFEVVGLISRWPNLQSKHSQRRYLWSQSGVPLAPLVDLWSHSIEPLLDEYLAGVVPQQRERELDGLRKVFLAKAE